MKILVKHFLQKSKKDENFLHLYLLFVFIYLYCYYCYYYDYYCYHYYDIVIIIVIVDLFIISFKLLKLIWIYSAKRESFR